LGCFINSNGIKQRVAYDLGQLIYEFQKNVSGNGRFINYNPDISITQEFLAEMFQCKSQTSGWYWQKVLYRYGLIKVTNRLIVSNTIFRLKTDLGFVYTSAFLGKKCCRMPNKIQCL